ncbi:MAG: FAD-dependent oxidoreductase, partial [Pseudobdellovibrio sp.]
CIRDRSNTGIDYGASLIGNNNVLALELLKYLNLESKAIDKNYVYLAEGMQRLPDSLVERVIGLIPYRNFRLRWKLVAIEKMSSGYTLTFENPNGQKKFTCRKIALAIPPTQWTSVAGLLELPEMKWANSWLGSLETQNTIKIILPIAAIGNSSKSFVETSYENLTLRQVVKRGRSSPIVEVDVSYLSKEDVSIDYIYNALKKKLQISYPFQKLSTEQFYDWKQTRLIRGSSFKNFLAVPEPINYNFQVVGDFTANSGIYTLEGALQSAKLASELFL